jgi:outer membrane immunogenic protein
MKKLVIALTALAAFTGSASAADLAARPYTKAPAAVPTPVASWTGCYVGAGGGGAYSNNDHRTVDTATGVPITANTTTGARGWFGTVGAGCDYQFDRWVVGVFGDYDFMDVKGDIGNIFGVGFTGQQKQDWQWAVGGRLGYAVLPNLLGYVSGGFTQGHWKSTNYSFFGFPPSLSTSGFTRDGWFIGAGDEYALGFLPGLFWKTEYRYSEFDRASTPIVTLPALAATGFSENQKVREHSVRSELVYRFNWGGPVVAKY